jgi:hypothetical protein
MKYGRGNHSYVARSRNLADDAPDIRVANANTPPPYKDLINKIYSPWV